MTYRPGYKAPVRHRHGSRRQERYEELDERTSIEEQMEDDRPYRYESRKPGIFPFSEDAWRIRMGLMEDPAKVTVTQDRRVLIHVLAKDMGLTSAQTLLLVNKHFGEYAKHASSSVAMIVANEIRRWAKTDEGFYVLAQIKAGNF